MISPPPRSDESGESDGPDAPGAVAGGATGGTGTGGAPGATASTDGTTAPTALPILDAGWSVEGMAGRAALRPEEVDRASRTYWESEAAAYQAEHGAFLGGAAAATSVGAGGEAPPGPQPVGPGTGFVWGPEGLTEDEARLLGPTAALPGQHVLEVGCGAAQCSAWLAARGAHAVGVDISVNQLRHARAPVDREPGDSGSTAEEQPRPGTGSLRLVAATATALPFRDAIFDAAFSSYGAIQFAADLDTLLREVRRVLRAGGRWVLSVTHPVRWAFPDDPGATGLTATGSYFDRRPYVERDAAGAAVYAEFHRTLGDYVAALTRAGFTIEEMVEPEWPDWNTRTWGGWSPLRGAHLPGTLIIGCRAGARSSTAAD